jgi:hypothetical protein
MIPFYYIQPADKSFLFVVAGNMTILYFEYLYFDETPLTHLEYYEGVNLDDCDFFVVKDRIPF